MFNTLVESRATRSRSTKSTMASVLLHGVIIASAVSLTMATKGDAKPQPPEPPIIFIPADLKPPPVTPRTPTSPTHQAPPPSAPWTIVVPPITPKGIPPIDVNALVPPDDAVPRLVGPGGFSSPYPAGSTASLPPGTIVNSDAVERVPHILGDARAPRYPDALRQSNIAGSVSVRFVVDTLGRAEMKDLEIVETSHPLFAEAVKSALAFYRFSPGEVGGRKVRTMVQIPFTFSLTK